MAQVASNKEEAHEDAMRQLCRLVVDTSYEDLPSSLVNRAKRSILDTLAVTVGGSAMEGIDTTVAYVKEKGGKPETTIPFYGGKVPASEAGLAIGPMSRAMDYGDVDMVVGHSSEYILPAMLAALGLKKTVSGKEFITAFVAGSEVLVRTGLLARPGVSISIGRDGGHYIFGCVAAVGKLLNLSQDELEEAQGIASAMTQPHSTLMYSPPTLMIRLHHGFICQDAINACLLALRGITGPRSGVLSDRGGYQSFVTWETDPGAVTQGLGRVWEMTRLTMKHHPIAASASTTIDGMLSQMEEHRFSAGDIDRINLELDVRLADRINQPEARKAQWHPETPHDCQFSVPYGLSSVIHDGYLFLDSYTEEARAREDVRALMPKITVTRDESLPLFAARINTILKNGRKVTNTYRYPKGHPENPMSDTELLEKFSKCVGYSAFKVSDSVSATVAASVLSLESVDDVAESLISPLTPA